MKIMRRFKGTANFNDTFTDTLTDNCEWDENIFIAFLMMRLTIIKCFFPFWMDVSNLPLYDKTLIKHGKTKNVDTDYISHVVWEAEVKQFYII